MKWHHKTPEELAGRGSSGTNTHQRKDSFNPADALGLREAERTRKMKEEEEQKRLEKKNDRGTQNPLYPER